jgi:hypothetical protein
LKDSRLAVPHASVEMEMAVARNGGNRKEGTNWCDIRQEHGR